MEVFTILAIILCVIVVAVLLFKVSVFKVVDGLSDFSSYAGNWESPNKVKEGAVRSLGRIAAGLAALGWILYIGAVIAVIAAILS